MIAVVTDAEDKKLEKQLAQAGVFFLRNEVPEQEEISAAIGLNYLADKCDRVFLFKAERPLIDPDTLLKMLEVEDAMVIPVHNGKQGQPWLMKVPYPAGNTFDASKAAKLNVEDITIFGMGGELIASIIDAAPWTRDAAIRLVLQPMSHAEILRAYLLENGFYILDQTLVKEDKVYQIICAEYDGVRRTEDDMALWFGSHNIERMHPLLGELLENKRRLLQTSADGKKMGGKDATFENRMLEQIDALLGRIQNKE